MTTVLAPYIHIDESGEVWFYPTGQEPQRLEDLDNLCGVLFFETGLDDPFFEACRVHDNLYRNRRFFEERGWDRAKMDDLFLRSMLEIAGDDVDLQTRAWRYYNLVRLFGGFFYYRHEPKEGGIKHRKHPNSNIRRT